MGTSALVKKLIQIPICRGLTEAEVAEVFQIAVETSIEKGHSLFKEGEPGDAFYVLLEGQLEITKQDRSGVQQSLARLGDGSALGEMSLITGNSPRSASALALSDLKLLKFPAETFSRLLREEKVAALKIVHNLAQVMSRRLLLMDEKLVEVMDRGKKKEELVDFQKILNDWSF